MKKIAKSIPLLLGVFLFCITTSVSAQELLKPDLKFDEACNDAATVNFLIEFGYRTTTFNADNVFTIEMSDADGVFQDPATNLGTVSTENSSFTFSRSITLPEGTFGNGYKIRLVSTSPAMISPESDVFEAYYDMFTDSSFGINNDDDLVLCNGSSEEVQLTIDRTGEYLWYKLGTGGASDTLIATTQEPKLTITETGTYQVFIDYGACGFAKSRILTVIGLGVSDSQISGPSTVEICGDATHTFEANVNDASYEYQWFKDGEAIAGATSASYTTPNVGQFGKYTLQITAGSCVTTSNEVELKQETTASFTVSPAGTTQIYLPGETKEICISHDAASSATIQWYKDGFPLAARTQLCMNVTEPGEYIARVTEVNASGCDVIVDSEPYRFIEATSFNPTIRTDNVDYQDCAFSNEKLVIVGVEAVGADGNNYNLSADQVTLLNYQWNKDSSTVTGATNEELDLNSYLDSGLYTLTVNVSTVSGTSNELDIKLIEFPEVVSTSVSNSLCPGGDIRYTINNVIAGYTYLWFKDGVDVTQANPNELVVTEVGEYVLQVSGFSCVDIQLDPISVTLFDDSSIIITPSEKVVMDASGSVTITASGGDSYEWFQGEDAVGTTLSTTEQLTVSSLGFYSVLVKVGNCSLAKKVEVVEQDDLVLVPNVVTPNGDGKNDTWKISNRYAFQPSVTIIIYNSEGKELINSTDYKNDWPIEDVNNQRVFYYKIIRDDKTLKAGTISVLH
ncbi:gliding motility-associated C-terminal domain-containing protein [Tenacibaculum sp. S7007]|uniref:Gliding motility-associated C-terminal domain-containing protein n=1 Tax=Tenacibaculum pelagium TaxID=2759527 RepID=A0A839ANT8_9FLAO|nr:gliding motility-associated C-terminal domain-containing protein [Tenacibaculum pelagium]MBA6155391.1 gliding motility-associated C-terminal domain-containing protein [Tenacibaculum pelagium]